MGLKESLRKLHEQEMLDKKLSLKREVKKELTKLKNEKILDKKCSSCGDVANYSIKGSSDWYCKECAIEYFGDLKHLKKTNTPDSSKNNKEIFFITSNDKKFAEMQSIIPEIKQLKIELDEVQDLDAKKIISKKLLDARSKVKGGSFIVEDTSLYIECLNGLPGPLIKFFVQSIGDKGMYEIAAKFRNDKAQARTLIGYYNRGKIKYFQGIVEGRIVRPERESKFGWDAIFMPEGYDKVFGEMNTDEKNEISMRGIAARKLRDYLKK
ncbi:MAG TPA: non-canonical purine NTP pyrophosphatase [Alphaproteobacteria bacterium]|nr:non-canonical purine NTP pyrophosphatase [Alphaproteobacteria bacterium]